MIDLNEIRTLAHQIQPQVVEIRRHLHQNPELSEHEQNTQAFIMETLKKEGIPCEKIADTGVLAIITGTGGGKVIGLRGDIDALPLNETSNIEYCSRNPGVMHACGHDAHTSIALGAGIVFNKLKSRFSGTIKLFFQPAEETIGGADRMVKEGCLENPKVDNVLGLHVMPYLNYDQIELKYGTLNASTDTQIYTVKGKSGHGAYPDLGVDAIAIACQIVCATQTIVSRNISPLESAVITFGKIVGGTKSNIIAEKVVMDATVRASNPDVRRVLLDRSKEIAQSIATAMGGTCEISRAEDGYPSLVNNDSIVDIVRESANEVVGADNIFEKKAASMGGEDFSFFIKNVPGAFYHIGCKKPGKEPYNIHTNEFDIDERCLETGIVMQVNTSLKLMGK